MYLFVKGLKNTYRKAIVNLWEEIESNVIALSKQDKSMEIINRISCKSNEFGPDQKN